MDKEDIEKLAEVAEHFKHAAEIISETEFSLPKRQKSFFEELDKRLDRLAVIMGRDKTE